MSLFEENAESLRQIASKGGNFSVARMVDFSHIFSDQLSAEKFADAAAGHGFEVKIEEIEDHECLPWDVTASKSMIPTCENITQNEEYLDQIAQKYGGRADGWGFWRIDNEN